MRTGGERGGNMEGTEWEWEWEEKGIALEKLGVGTGREVGWNWRREGGGNWNRGGSNWSS